MLKIEYWEIGRLNEYKNNPRKNDHAVDKICTAIKEFGFKVPIIAKSDGTIVDGHLRFKAAKKLNIENVPVILADDLSEEQIKAFRISINKMSELAEWDIDLLKSEFLDLKGLDFDLELTGFSADEIDMFLKPPIRESDGTEDNIPENVETRCKPGDLWILGNHRLLCGDSTNIQHVEILMNGEKADICFTSPPYNLGNNAKLRGHNGDGEDSIYNGKTDHRTDKEYFDFLIQSSALSLMNSRVVFWNIQLLANNKLTIPDFWHHYKNHIIDLMIWDKEHAQLSMSERVLNSVFEFIFILSSEENPKRSIKTGKNFRGTIDNIYRLNPVGKKDPLAKDHGGVFPVQFAEFFVNNFSEKSVYEPFSGSGSTLIACEKTGRRCFGMEIDPHYCDVILKRWEQYTGKQAVLEDPS